MSAHKPWTAGSTTRTLIFIGAACLAAMVARADTTPRSSTASPDVYKVLAEEKGLRVIIATWKPGQRDQLHSHPVMAVYWLTDCPARIYSPDGTYQDTTLKAGHGGVQGIIEAHSFENRSASECKAVMVERE